MNHALNRVDSRRSSRDKSRYGGVSPSPSTYSVLNKVLNDVDSRPNSRNRTLSMGSSQKVSGRSSKSDQKAFDTSNLDSDGSSSSDSGSSSSASSQSTVRERKQSIDSDLDECDAEVAAITITPPGENKEEINNDKLQQSPPKNKLLQKFRKPPKMMRQSSTGSLLKSINKTNTKTANKAPWYHYLGKGPAADMEIDAEGGVIVPGGMLKQKVRQVMMGKHLSETTKKRHMANLFVGEIVSVYLV